MKKITDSHLKLIPTFNFTIPPPTCFFGLLGLLGLSLACLARVGLLGLRVEPGLKAHCPGLAGAFGAQ